MKVKAISQSETSHPITSTSLLHYSEPRKQKLEKQNQDSRQKMQKVFPRSSTAQ